MSRFSGLLLRRGGTLSPYGRGATDILSTGGNAVSPRQTIQCADHIGVFLKTALPTREVRLRLAVVRVDIARTGSAGVGRCAYRSHPAVFLRI